MASDENGSEPPKRDVHNHVFFEIATEVANRGAMLFLPSPGFMQHTDH